MATRIQDSVDGLLIRGGTSKGLFVRTRELPDDPSLRDDIVLDLFGSPDPHQIDGIGGSYVHTSKIVIVEPSDREGVHVDYTFGQVNVDEPIVDYTGNCGNLTSAVGISALHEGIVQPNGSPTEIVLYNTNTDTVVEQTVPMKAGAPAVDGAYAIDGVPGTGPRIDSRFVDPAGGITAKLLPTDHRCETVEINGNAYELSIVDAANPNVFLRAADFGLSGTELPDQLRARPTLLETLERIRGVACYRMGLVDTPADASIERPLIPQLALLSEPQSYEPAVGDRVDAGSIDVTARMINNAKPHHAYAATASMCLAAATHLPGTIPGDVAKVSTGQESVTIGHPKGRITIGTSVSRENGELRIDGLTVGRTARALVQGQFFHRPITQISDRL